MSRTRTFHGSRTTVLLAALAAAALLAAFLPAVAGGRPLATGPGEGKITPEDMREAEPIGPVRPSSAADAPTTQALGPRTPGPPTFVPPVRPGDSSPTTQLEPGSPPDAESGYKGQSHQPYSVYEITNPNGYPYRTHGKLFVRERGASGWDECSATVVPSRHRSLIFTAGHCAFWRGRWIDDAVFAPAYRNGRVRFGLFRGRSVQVTPQWRDSQNLNFDIAAMRLWPNGGGRRVQSAVGTRGIAFSQPRFQFFQFFGYPFNYFNAERPILCESSFGGIDPHSDPVGPPANTMGCNMRAGSSGGSWVIDELYVDSLASYFYTDEPHHVYGPYFGSAVRTLWQRTNG